MVIFDNNIKFGMCFVGDEEFFGVIFVLNRVVGVF